MEEQQMMFELPKTASTMTIADLDGLVDTMFLARVKKKQHDAIGKELKEKVDEAEIKVMEALELLNKKSYKCEGVGTVTRVDKLSTRVPSTPEQKKEMFKWIQETMGTEAYEAYMTINSQALNKLYNEKVSEYGERGEIFLMPGVAAPTARTILSFRKN